MNMTIHSNAEEYNACSSGQRSLATNSARSGIASRPWICDTKWSMGPRTKNNLRTLEVNT